MSKLNEIMDRQVERLRTNLAYSAPELHQEKLEEHRLLLNGIADKLYDALGPAADEILEDL